MGQGVSSAPVDPLLKAHHPQPDGQNQRGEYPGHHGPPARGGPAPKAGGPRGEEIAPDPAEQAAGHRESGRPKEGSKRHLPGRGQEKPEGGSPIDRAASPYQEREDRDDGASPHYLSRGWSWVKVSSL